MTIPRRHFIENDIGFTLMELMACLGIMAVISIITVSQFIGWLPDYRLKSAALDLFSMFQTARMLAIKDRAEYAIVFNTAEGSYDLVSGGPDKIYNGGHHPNDDRVLKRVFLTRYGSGVRFGCGAADKKATVNRGGFGRGDEVSFGDDTAMFNAQGMAAKMGYVYLQNNIQSAYAVATVTRVGVVILKRWHGSDWD